MSIICVICRQPFVSFCLVKMGGTALSKFMRSSLQRDNLRKSIIVMSLFTILDLFYYRLEEHAENKHSKTWTECFPNVAK
jgi:Zinc-binding